MNWKGQELTTIGDLMYKGIDACGSPEEAQEFMRLYRAENEHADVNIGYLSGYYGPEKMRQIQQWFGVAHPVFGTTVPTPEEAIAAGKAEGPRPVLGADKAAWLKDRLFALAGLVGQIRAYKQGCVGADSDMCEQALAGAVLGQAREICELMGFTPGENLDRLVWDDKRGTIYKAAVAALS